MKHIFERFGPGCFCILLALGNPCFAQEETTTVYKRIMPDGSVSYSDQASDQSETMEVAPVPTVPALETAPSRQQRSASPKTGEVYQLLRVASPEHDSAFYSGNGSMTIDVEIEPALRRGHSLQLILDGQLISTQNSPNFALDLVDRGTHTVQINAIDRRGKIIKSAQSRFTIHRPIVR